MIKILIVDDAIAINRLLKSILQKAGIKDIFTANSGSEALAILSKNPDVDIILMDIMMENGDGMKTTQTILKHPKFNKLPIIMISALSSKEAIMQSFKYGAKDYIIKPISKIDLLSKIEKVLNRKIFNEDSYGDASID